MCRAQQFLIQTPCNYWLEDTAFWRSLKTPLFKGQSSYGRLFGNQETFNNLCFRCDWHMLEVYWWYHLLIPWGSSPHPLGMVSLSPGGGLLIPWWPSPLAPWWYLSPCPRLPYSVATTNAILHHCQEEDWSILWWISIVLTSDVMVGNWSTNMTTCADFVAACRCECKSMVVGKHLEALKPVTHYCSRCTRRNNWDQWGWY